MTITLNDLRNKLRNEPNTRDLHMVGGKYTPARKALHAEIIAKTLAGIKKSSEPTFVTMGGLPGSGKSSIANQKNFSNFVKVDSDAIKKQFPEYQGWNAARLHTEADDVISRMLATAKRRKLNILFDGTMKSGPKMANLMNRNRRLGYKNGMLFARLSPEKAMQRVLDRLRKGGLSGRFVDPQYVGTHDLLNEAVFNSLKARTDMYQLFNTDVPRNTFAELINSAGSLSQLK